VSHRKRHTSAQRYGVLRRAGRAFTRVCAVYVHGTRRAIVPGMLKQTLKVETLVLGKWLFASYVTVVEADAIRRAYPGDMTIRIVPR
jgi:hypothetical protein